MDVENILKEFREFVGQVVPESVSYKVKKDAQARNIKQDMMRQFRHEKNKAVRKNKGASLSERELDKVLKLSLIKICE